MLDRQATHPEPTKHLFLLVIYVQSESVEHTTH